MAYLVLASQIHYPQVIIPSLILPTLTTPLNLPYLSRSVLRLPVRSPESHLARSFVA